MKIDKIGENIKISRSKRNISQADLAAKLSLSTRQISEIESGNSISTIETLENIAQALDIPLDFLFKDCNKEFLVYTIDDYLNLINRDYAKNILNELLNMMEVKNRDV